MVTISLNREFIEWKEGDELADPELRIRFGFSDGGLSWENLLTKHRVVILAEAGSGKSEELQATWTKLVAGERFAFYATVEDIGRQGLEKSLLPNDRSTFGRWKASDQPAWFFIDSVDEAKLNNVRLESALRNLAEAVLGAEQRSHIVLSGRHTDWQSRRDLLALKKLLPITSSVEATPPAIDPNDALAKIFRPKPKAEKPQPVPDEPLIALMTPLDEPRVRLFAEGKQIPDIDGFLAGIDKANLWRFARRPLDLSWLTEIWQENRSFSTLERTLETSLRHRLVEPTQERARRQKPDVGHAFNALERTGAALVFCRRSTIAIPDDEFAVKGGGQPLDLAAVLPDWSADERASFLSQPVFDPATFGQARLHNDNEGAVRSYLAARWLLRMTQKGLQKQSLLDLLFARTYEMNVVKPSMRETAAWLSIWDPDVATEILDREPYLLMTAGDPASLSPNIRRRTLCKFAEILASGKRDRPLIDSDALKRFATSDIASTIRSIWKIHKAKPDILQTLLRLITLGPVSECVDLVEGCAYDAKEDVTIRVLAGRAIVDAGDAAMQSRYANYVRGECCRLPVALVWEALEKLFPSFLSISDLGLILNSVDITDRGGSVGFSYFGPKLVDRINTIPDLEHFTEILLDRVGEAPPFGTPPTDEEEIIFPILSAAAERLLKRSGPDDAPVVAIDAVGRIGSRTRGMAIIRKPKEDPQVELQRTTERRRKAFWRIAELHMTHPAFGTKKIESVMQMQMLGYTPALGVEDLDWLLVDAPHRAAVNERELAVDAALTIWSMASRPPNLFERIEAAASIDAVMTTTLERSRPRAQSAEELAASALIKQAEERAAAEGTQQERAWSEFVAKLRADPKQLRNVLAPTATTVDSRLYHLWDLLQRTAGANSRYSIPSTEILEPILGRDLCNEVRDALIRHWRAWKPTLKSEKEPARRNTYSAADGMGITGVGLEAFGDARWAERLSSAEAMAAASYATLEINGLPAWTDTLASAKPDELESVLMNEIVADLRDAGTTDYFGVLDAVNNSSDVVQRLIAMPLLQKLQENDVWPTKALAKALDVIVAGLIENRDRFSALVVARALASSDLHAAALYLGAAFAFDSEAAIKALMKKLGKLKNAGKITLVQHLLPRLFGNGFGSLDSSFNPQTLPFASLYELVRIAYSTIRVKDDNKHPAMETFSPDARDHAEGARNAAFNQLFGTPGGATVNALLRLSSIRGFPIPALRLKTLARERATLDSESARWRPQDVEPFETEFEIGPRTTKDLQLVALRRIADIEHALIHGDFSAGRPLSSARGETAVQNQVAERLRFMQKHAYSVEREINVAEEKSPDIRIRAPITDASVPIEIKIVEDWKLRDLEAALDTQLCKQYLRAKKSRHGILLLVHQKPRRRGWRDTKTGKYFSFDGVVRHLEKRAKRITARGPDAPQPEVAVINISEQWKPPRISPIKRRARTKNRKKPRAH